MSAYFNNLQLENPDVAKRYLLKISPLDGVDPYLLKEDDVSYKPEDFPAITNMDIVSYLVLTTSFYTKDQMKAFKSLNAFKYFQAGFVTNCGVVNINNLFVLLGSVKHSQRLTEPPLRVWIICSESGSIESAHCTCMAGAGEVCSHVGALLFAVEYINTSRTTTSCTDVRSMWNVPKVSEVRCMSLSDINFGRIVKSSRSTNIPPVTAEELCDVLQQIKEAGGSCVLMRVVEPFADELATPVSLLRNILTELYNEEYETLDLGELMQLAEKHLQLQITNEEIQKIEEATKGQSRCNEWFHQRAGRITASHFKQVCRTSATKPSLSLIKQICYPVKFQFKTKATEWGITHEQQALEDYKRDAAAWHENFNLELVGLVIRSDLPQFGASPDAKVKCTCCGTGCVEIKCPYLLKTLSLIEFAKKNNTCLVYDNGEIRFDINHSYYYQIQHQMALTQTSYCDFIVWSPSEGFFVERVPYNDDFWCCNLQTALHFHKMVIIPELLGRLFTRSTPSISTWCICNEPDDGTPMLCCENELCNIKWFHLSCVGLTDVPDDQWICNSCNI